jgi:triosephosphate isomerase (TIM)
MTKKIFAANWKLNKTPEEAREFIITFKNQIFKTADFFKTREVIIFPQAYSIEAVASLCAGTSISFGPQNIYFENSGAFTGENSAEVAKQLKSSFALVGHSERREIFKEQDEMLNKKNLLLNATGLVPVFCIGESLAQREANQTFEVCRAQLERGLKNIDKSKRIIVAYEPIWAIGTGIVATSQQVAEVHAKLYSYMKKQLFADFQLLYGGSVKPENAVELLAIDHVDGFLIGGAALKTESFLKICGV